MTEFNWREPDYSDVYARRKVRLDKIRGDDAWHHAERFYATRPADFIEHWLVTYDPRNVNKGRAPYMPFLLFPKQREFIEWLDARFTSRETGLAEKSRDMGVSWLCCAYALWLWRFRPGAAVGFGSQKIEYVDQLGNHKSLFEKIRIMLRMLPKELRPEGFRERDHARHMRIINPATGSIIAGEGGDNIGRGDRTSLYFVDEAAYLEHAEAIDASLSNTTDVRVDVSTPNGNANPFYKKRVNPSTKVFTFHWSSDPRKDDAWYAEQCEKIGDPQIIARELDLDYEGSGGETVVSPKWVQASLALRKHLTEASALPEKGDGVAGLDVGAGVARSVFVPRWGALVGRSTAWSEADTTNTAARSQVLAGKHKCPVLKFDVIGVGQGVLSTLKRLDGARAVPINVGGKPTQRVWPDKKSSRDKFVNLRAEAWWVLRERLRKTHEHWQAVCGRDGKMHPLDELLLLPPDDGDLCTQITIPRFSYTETGKIQIERKIQMKARGVSSPDYADALVLTLAPAPQKARFGRATGLVG